MVHQLLDSKSKERLLAINNSYVNAIITKYIDLCKPAKVTVLTDSTEDLQYARELSLKNGEEIALTTAGHSYHFDGAQDQGRDMENTCILVKPGISFGKAIKTIDREAGLKEVLGLMEGIMHGKEMIIKFYCLGPQNSKFSIPALQITDSAYVVHSEDLLYRQGYSEFKRLAGSKNFFHFVHSAGELAGAVSKNVDKRRVYMDLEEERVFTINNQYAGNSVGLKKLALRLAISKANKEDWLCEHMFIMGVTPEGKDRTTYFTGAFPSACGKTSTAMVPGMSIVGDDIAYIRPDEEGFARAVNVEQGIFGIIADVNPVDDALIYKALTTPRELIFSNVLINSGKPYWLNMGSPLPKEGKSYCGEWKEGMLNKAGKPVDPAHKNARYTIRINELENADTAADDPNGVVVRGFIYGGRDSDSSVPVCQSLSWQHGVFVGAAIESETTATVVGRTEGVRSHNPMSNIEFLTVPLGVYIKNHIAFGEELDSPPAVFATNYFLKKDGKYVNDKVDKKIWLLWMEGRVHGEYDAIETPIGYIPYYADIKDLFMQVFKRNYTQEEYEWQFSIRTKHLLDKLDRIEKIFSDEKDIPQVFWDHLHHQRKRLQHAHKEYGTEIISPLSFIALNK